MNTKAICTAVALFVTSISANAEWTPGEWPVLCRYESTNLKRIALPLGGIGTGTVSLGGRGELRDWEIMNNPAKGFSGTGGRNDAPFFAIHLESNGQKSTLMLAGRPYSDEFQEEEGRPLDNFGLPRFRQAYFDAAYPFGQVHLCDPSLPVLVTVMGFNPLIPADEEASGLPVAILSYRVENTSESPINVSVCGSIRNFIGYDGSTSRTVKGNVNEFRNSNGLSGIFFRPGEVDSLSQAWGTMALVTEAGNGVTHRISSRANYWGNAMLDFWDDFSEDGTLTEKLLLEDDDPMGSLSITQEIPSHSHKYFTFYIVWDFPNRKAWSPEIEGNWYSTLYRDAWDAAERIIPRIPELEEQTLRFVNAFLGSSYPEQVKESALFNISTLRSQTVFRIKDGHMMGWEGVKDRYGSCSGSCTHVWNYETTTPFLFGNLAKSMRDVEFRHTLKDDGMMSFRAGLPLSAGSEWMDFAAADGQMGCIMKFYREWQLSGDDDFLRSNWQYVKKALTYAWRPDGWDEDMDGVMEGCQHNTMDVEYYGPNPQMQLWYFGALKAAEEMAVAMKDREFAKKCRRTREKGSEWIDYNLFNGEYYEHKITDPETKEFLDIEKDNIPDYQLGPGCLVDQLVGQYMAHICGLGYLIEPANVTKTLNSIFKYNYRDSFARHFNNMRSFVLDDDAGLLMASWPKGRLTIPFPYFNEVMTGFEYVAAVGMLYENMDEQGLQCIKSIRNRFDGARRNPFDEIECGHHYARAMAAWSSVIALSGFHYSAVRHSMSFTSIPGDYFWSTGYAWGTCSVTNEGATLTVIKGELNLDKFILSDKRTSEDGVSLLKKGLHLSEGKSISLLKQE